MAYTVYSFQIRYINFKFNLTIKLITEVPKGMNEQLLNSLWGRQQPTSVQRFRNQTLDRQVTVTNCMGSFLTEPIILPPTSTGIAASSDRTVIDSCSSLQWWSQHRSRYPSLVPVVRMFFGVPATSVPSERLFSKAGLVISDRRSRLSPQHAEQQCFMSCNWLD